MTEEYPASPMGARKGCRCLGCEIMRGLDEDRANSVRALLPPAIWTGIECVDLRGCTIQAGPGFIHCWDALPLYGDFGARDAVLERRVLEDSLKSSPIAGATLNTCPA